MDRRKMLKVLPLAAMAGVTMKIGETDAKAFEVKPDKKYLLVMPDVPYEQIRACSDVLRERGINATVCTGVEDLKIYELD